MFLWLKNTFIDVFERDFYAALLFFCLSFLLGFAIFWCVKHVILFVKNRRRKFLSERQVEFTLPDRENTYVRSRLATVLNTQFQSDAEIEEELPLTFAHAQTLLHKLWFAPLSQAERLEMEQLENSVKKYSMRTRFNAKDVRVVNDVFSRLLKLAAKHGV